MPTFVVNTNHKRQDDNRTPRTLRKDQNQNIWYEIKDSKSKKLFYFNEATQVSQWKKPQNVTIIPINQKGVAIIRGNGVIEKEYLNACSRLAGKGSVNTRHAYLNEEDHIIDPVKQAQSLIFGESATSETSPIDSDMSPSTIGLCCMYAMIPSMRDISPTVGSSYDSYVRSHFVMYRRGFLKGKTTVERITSYKSVPIKLPLLAAALCVKKEAVALNTEILNYVTMMCERSSQPLRQLLTEHREIHVIIALVIDNYQHLRNEVYCQVMKAMRGSPELWSSFRLLTSSIASNAWNIMAVLAGSIAPTEELLFHIQQVCHNSKSNRNYHALPSTTNELLKKTMVAKRREAIPTNAEIYAILVCCGEWG